MGMYLYISVILYTDKHENKIFLIYKEIQKGFGWKVINDWRPPHTYMVKYLRISSYIRKPFLKCDFATYPIWISLFTRMEL